MKSTYREILRHLRVEHVQFVNEGVLGDDFYETLERISKLKSANSRATLAKTLDKLLVDLKREASTDFMESLKRFLAIQLLITATHRYGSSAPALHHWVPLCYLKNFTRGLSEGNQRSRVVPGLRFLENGVVESIKVSDTKFAHTQSVKEGGHYELKAEYFFSIIEGTYSATITSRLAGKSREMGKIYATAMLLVQALRAPRNGEFLLRGFREIIEHLEILVEGLEGTHVYLQSSNEPLAFSTHVPTRSRRVKGGIVAYFPLSSDVALLVASRELEVHERLDMITKSQQATIAYARRTGDAIYGILPKDL